MATMPLDSAQARAANEAAELQSQKRSLEGLRQKLKSGPDMDKKLKQACEGFESIFMNKLWAQMRKTVPKEGYLHSSEEEAYLSMFDQELMKKMSEAGGIGLGKMLYENLSDHLAKASAGTASRLAGPTELKPLHPEAKAMPLHPEAATPTLRSRDLPGGVGENGPQLSAGDAARLAAEKVAEKAAEKAAETPAVPAGDTAAATPVILPPGFRGPDPAPAQSPEDLAALDRAMELARQVEGGRTARRAARAYRDAARDEASGVSAPVSPAPVAAPAVAPDSHESDT